MAPKAHGSTNRKARRAGARNLRKQPERKRCPKIRVGPVPAHEWPNAGWRKGVPRICWRTSEGVITIAYHEATPLLDVLAVITRELVHFGRLRDESPIP